MPTEKVLRGEKHCIAITGASGLVGQRLAASFRDEGHRVVEIGRGGQEVRWDPQRGVEWPSETLAGVDSVVHLAGENIAGGRWTAARKRAIRDSRVIGTRVLIESLSELEEPPRNFLCASAVGFYGDQGEEQLEEGSPKGEGFLADVCSEWERAAHLAEALGSRVALLRIGVVLSPDGGALERMLTPFRLGLGGKIGSGRQFMSWITIDDLIRAIRFVHNDDSLAGPINLTAPEPVTNSEFVAELGRSLRRPTFFPLPARAARLVLGEMADELLLASTRALPRRLLDAGFRFEHTGLASALGHLLDDP